MICAIRVVFPVNEKELKDDGGDEGRWPSSAAHAHTKLDEVRASGDVD